MTLFESFFVSYLVLLHYSLKTLSQKILSNETESFIPTDQELHCQPGSLTEFYGLVIQGVLAFLAFLSLIVKRFLEPPVERRSWLVWFFDTSKQATGASIIHILNVFLAQTFRGDPCTWYLVSFLLDSTIGLWIIYVGVKITSCVAKCKHYPTLRFGEYGKPPQCKPWLHQCLAFVGISILEKIIITITIQFPFWRNVRRMILRPISSPALELVITMLIVPLLVNTLMFWVIDNLTMRKLLRVNHRSAAGGRRYSEQLAGKGEIKLLLASDESDEVLVGNGGSNDDLVGSLKQRQSSIS